MIVPVTMLPQHRRYVVPTWAHSATGYAMPKRERFKLVDRILDGGADVVVIATGATVHAWACGEDDALHYVYVPPELRGKGLTRRLITALFGDYADHINVTHPWPRESARFRYVPTLLLRTAA